MPMHHALLSSNSEADVWHSCMLPCNLGPGAGRLYVPLLSWSSAEQGCAITQGGSGCRRLTRMRAHCAGQRRLQQQLPARAELLAGGGPVRGHDRGRPAGGPHRPQVGLRLDCRDHARGCARRPPSAACMLPACGIAAQSTPVITQPSAQRQAAAHARQQAAASKIGRMGSAQAMGLQPCLVACW